MAEKSKIEQALLEERSLTGIGALRPGTVQFVVQQGINVQSLHTMIDRVIGLHGCTGCGLVGLDLHFRVQDGLIFEKFKDIDGLRDVAIQRAF